MFPDVTSTQEMSALSANQQAQLPRIVTASARNFRGVPEPESCYNQPLMINTWSQTTLPEFENSDEDELIDYKSEREKELEKTIKALQENLKAHTELLSQIQATSERSSELLGLQHANNQTNDNNTFSTQLNSHLNHNNVFNNTNTSNYRVSYDTTQHSVSSSNDNRPAQLSSKIVNAINSTQKVSSSSTESVKYRIIAENTTHNNEEPIEIQLAEEESNFNLNSSADSGRLEICLGAEENVANYEIKTEINLTQPSEAQNCSTPNITAEELGLRTTGKVIKNEESSISYKQPTNDMLPSSSNSLSQTLNRNGITRPVTPITSIQELNGTHICPTGKVIRKRKITAEEYDLYKNAESPISYKPPTNDILPCSRNSLSQTPIMLNGNIRSVTPLTPIQALNGTHVSPLREVIRERIINAEEYDLYKNGKTIKNAESSISLKQPTNDMQPCSSNSLSRTPLMLNRNGNIRPVTPLAPIQALNDAHDSPSGEVIKERIITAEEYDLYKSGKTINNGESSISYKQPTNDMHPCRRNSSSRTEIISVTPLTPIQTLNGAHVSPPGEVSRNSQDEMISLGPNNTLVPAKLYESIDWNSTSIATRKLLMATFERNVLASHSMTGKPSPAFKHSDKPIKKMLDPHKIADIIYAVSRKCNVAEKEVRNVITTKCADENKMMKLQMNKRAIIRESNKENFSE